MNDFAFRTGTAVVVGTGDPATIAIASTLVKHGSAVTLHSPTAAQPLTSDDDPHTLVFVSREHPLPDDFADLLAGVLPRLRRAQGSVVVVTSAGHEHQEDEGLDGLVRNLAVAERPHGVRINHVAVGELLDDSPLTGEPPAPGLIGTVWDIAEAVCFLGSDRAGFISGQRLVVNGGVTAARPSHRELADRPA